MPNVLRLIRNITAGIRKRYKIDDVVDFNIGHWYRGTIVGGNHVVKALQLRAVPLSKWKKRSKKIGTSVRVNIRQKYYSAKIVLVDSKNVYLEGNWKQRTVELDSLDVDDPKAEYTFRKKGKNKGIRVLSYRDYYVVIPYGSKKHVKVESGKVTDPTHDTTELKNKATDTTQKRVRKDKAEDFDSFLELLDEHGEKTYRKLTKNDWSKVKQAMHSVFALLEEYIGLRYNIASKVTWFGPDDKKKVLSNALTPLKRAAKQLVGNGVKSIGDTRDTVLSIYEGGLSKGWNMGDFSSFGKQQLEKFKSFDWS